MRDTESLRQQVEEEKKNRRIQKHIHEHGECDLCGIIGRIVEGLCIPCRDKFKLWGDK